MYEGLYKMSFIAEPEIGKERWMSEIRRYFNPQIKSLSKRIDQASESYVMTGDVVHLTHYRHLCRQMIEIKESIIEMENGCVR